MREYYRELKPAARKLRRNMTEAEALLWSKIRMKQINGFFFSRQKPLGGYIVDFYCHKASLVIEIDGAHHSSEEMKLNDKFRDEYLTDLGLKILRFNNDKVLSNTDEVIKVIKKNL